MPCHPLLSSLRLPLCGLVHAHEGTVGEESVGCQQIVMLTMLQNKNFICLARSVVLKLESGYAFKHVLIITVTIIEEKCWEARGSPENKKASHFVLSLVKLKLKIDLLLQQWQLKLQRNTCVLSVLFPTKGACKEDKFRG